MLARCGVSNSAVCAGLRGATVSGGAGCADAAPDNIATRNRLGRQPIRSNEVEIGMIELVLVYCLNSSPDTCLERRQPLVPPVNMMSCQMGAQTAAQEYLEMHPRYRLAR